MIPKRISFFWCGKKMSWMRYMTLYSFRVLNPDWDMYLYVSEANNFKKSWLDFHSQDFFEYRGEDYFNKIEELDIKIIEWVPPIMINPVAQSDLFQWELLSTEGGIYSDLDILYVKPLDYEKIKEYDVLYCLADNQFAIGFLGGSKNNHFYRLVYKVACSRVDDTCYQAAGIDSVYALLGVERWQITNFDYVGSKIPYFMPTARICNLPQETIYPWTWRDASVNIFEATYLVPEETIGIHWYAGAPMSQKYNCELTERSINQHMCTYTRYANEILFMAYNRK